MCRLNKTSECHKQELQYMVIHTYKGRIQYHKTVKITVLDTKFALCMVVRACKPSTMGTVAGSLKVLTHHGQIYNLVSCLKKERIRKCS